MSANETPAGLPEGTLAMHGNEIVIVYADRTDAERAFNILESLIAPAPSAMEAEAVAEAIEDFVADWAAEEHKDTMRRDLEELLCRASPPKPQEGVVEALREEWHTEESAPRDGTVIEAVGGYLDATAGFPRYVMFRDGAWFDCSRHNDEVIIWAWRPRTDWPHSPCLSSKGRTE
ncbi:hypothetical protein [Mesorhizobium sp.]|uniref:hypothetical protein n=1 Tax=Mesorhizobium sp. TaxID=1871066 RepID=UPI000FE5970B|nr:hypothetical protein [Mesorhizobium sp.]RWN33450.1 MAG: hypothetical protein EOR95_16015 [Mesorhizobium sp.]